MARLFFVIFVALHSLAACESGLQVSTDGVIDQRCIETDGKDCVARDSAAAEQGFQFIMNRRVTNLDDSELRWTDYVRANGGKVSYDLAVALDEACTKPVTSFKKLQTTSQRLDFIQTDGTYYFCLFAEAKDQKVPATNNGLRVTIDRTPPKIEGPIAFEKNASFQIDLTIYDLTDVAIKWGIVDGPGDAIFSTPDSKSTKIAMSAEGSYKIKADVSDKAGNSSSKIFDVIWDQTPPAIELGSTIYLGSKAELTPQVDPADIAHYTWSVASTPNKDARLTLSDPLMRNPIVSANANGAYEVRLTVSDRAGNTASDTFTVDWNASPIIFTSAALVNQAANGYINAPESMANDVIVGDPVGTDFNFVHYKLVARDVTCASVMGWETIKPLASSATTDGIYKICVRLTDNRGKTPAYGSTAEFTRKVTPPNFTSISLSGDAADGYINKAERSGTNNLVTDLKATSFDAVTYVLTASANSCASLTTYQASIPRSDSTMFGSDLAYKVCVKLTDNAGNAPKFGESLPIILDTAAPVLNSLNAANEASDGYVSSAEIDATGEAYALSAIGFVTVRYTMFLSDSVPVTCDAAKAYDRASIPLINEIPKQDGSYVICAKPIDTAGNFVYGRSKVINRSTVPPTAVLSGQPTGISNSVNLNITVSGTSVSHYKYKIGTAALDCADAVGYSAERPQTTGITDSIAGLDDGDIKLCVIARNSIGSYQLVTNATQAAWIKDSVIPTVAIAAVTISKANQAAVGLSGTCSENGNAVVIGGAKTGSATCINGVWNLALNYGLVADGKVLITANHADVAGNKAVQAEFNASKDATPPTVAFNPLAVINNANPTAVPVSGTCSESGQAVVIGGASSQTVNCVSGTWSSNLDYSQAADGAVAITVNHSDSFGNSAVPATGNFTKDTVDPTVTLGTLVVINNQNKAAVPVNGTCSESGKSVVIGGAATASINCASGLWSTTLNYTGAGDGNVAITVDHKDAAGNKAKQVSGAFVKDATNPTVTIDQLVAINSSNKAAIPVKGSCSENGRTVTIGGAVSAVITCTGNAWSKTMDYSGVADGSVLITADHTDAAGNNAAQAHDNFIKDTAGPTVAINPITINNTNKAAATVNGSCSENGRTVSIGGAVSASATCNSGSWSKAIDYRGQADGEVLITADHADSVGNEATQAQRKATKDTVMPTVSFDTLPFINVANKKAVPLSGQCSENGQTVTIGGAVSSSTSCNAGSWAATIDFSLVADGSVSVKVNHDDAAGNSATQGTGSLTKDTVIPTVKLNSLIVINSNNKSAVPASGTCSENGVAVIIGGAVNDVASCVSGSWSKTIDYSSQPDGSVAITLLQTDNAGNAATLVSGAYAKDTVIPTVTLNAGTINMANKSAVQLSGSCSESGQTVKIGGAVSSTTTCAQGAWAKTINYSTQPDGNVIIRVDHKDVAGNDAAQVNAAFAKDTVAPTLTFDAPLPVINNANKTTTPVQGTCSEEGRDVVISGGVSATVTCVSGKWSKNADLSSLVDGSITITIQQKDALGNASQLSATLSKDTADPTVSVNDVIINNQNKKTVTIKGSCSEHGRSVTIGGAVSATATCSYGSWSKLMDYSGQPDGDVMVTIEHKDASGNTAAVSRNLLKDTVLPSLSLDPLVVINNTNKTLVHVSGGCSEIGRTVSLGGPRAASVLCSFGVWAVDIDYSGVADGSFAITVDHSDAAGNAALRVNGIFTKDTELPLVTINAITINAGNKSAAPLAGSCSENGAPVTLSGAISATATCSAGSWTQTLDFSGAPEGILTIIAQHVDAVGNGIETSRSIEKDTVAPTVALDVLVAISASNQTSVPVSGTCSENGQTIGIGGAVTATTICNSGSWSHKLNYQSMPDGKVAITASHKDKAGNDAIPASSQFTKDTNPPVVDAGTDRLTNGTVTQDATVTGAASYAWIKVSGPGSISFGSSNAEDTIISASADGTYVLRLTATDAVGNSAFDEMNFVRKTTPPNAVIMGAPTGTSDVNILDITIGGAGVTEYAYKILDNGVTDCANPSAYSSFRDVAVHITADITASPYGAGVKLCVIGKDALANVASSASASSTSWHRDTPSYRYYRLVVNSMEGDCDSGKNIIENIEVKFKDIWQPTSFSGASGTMGFYTQVIVSASSTTGENEPWKAFGTGYWQGAKEFDVSAPFDSEAPSFLKWDFGDGKLVAIQGLRLKGGTGDSVDQYCSPDAFRLEGSLDDKSWKEMVGSSRAIGTTQQVQYLFRPRPGTADDFVLYSGDIYITGSWKFGGGTEIGHLIVRRADSPVTWVPANGTSYTPSSADADHTIVYVGPGKSHMDAGLTAGKTYHYAIYSYDSNNLYSASVAADAVAHKVSECRALVTSCTSWCSNNGGLSCLSIGIDGDATDGSYAATNSCDAADGAGSCNTVNENSYARCRCQ